jgi:hypothetical protein
MKYCIYLSMIDLTTLTLTNGLDMLKATLQSLRYNSNTDLPFDRNI